MTGKIKQQHPKGKSAELSEMELDQVSAAGTDAEFDNLVGFYEITDTSGGIDRKEGSQTSFANAAYRLGHT